MRRRSGNVKCHWLISCLLCLAVALCVRDPAAGQTPGKPRPEPQLLSAFPLGATQGARIRVELRGQNLEHAYAVSFDCAAITGEIQSIEPIKPEGEETGKGKSALRIQVDLVVAPDTQLGQHTFRAIGPRGVSNPLPFFVYKEPVSVEADLKMEGSPPRHRIPKLPAVISGTLAAAGEVDSYLFQVEAEQELFFEVLHSGRTDPELAIYEQAGSWFDPKALRRLAFNDEPNTASKNLSPALNYRFQRKGTFLVNVTSFLGRGGPENSYQLRIVSSADKGFAMSAPKFAHPIEGWWQERSFARELRMDRLDVLKSRTVDVNGPKPFAVSELKS